MSEKTSLISPKIVYLYCSVEESLRRKDDIDNKELFITVKKRFDDYFLNRKGVLSLDTGFFSREEIANSIIQYIEQ